MGIPLGLEIGDMNGDGLQDLLVPISHTNLAKEMLIFYQNNSGAFDSGTSMEIHGVSGYPVFPYYPIVSKDIDQDGRNDIIGVSRWGWTVNSHLYTGSRVAVYLQNAAGDMEPFAYSYPYPKIAGGPGDGLAVDDIDGDGRPDVIFTRPCILTTDACTSGITIFSEYN